ncbi:MAG: hypothetical protein HY973_00580 [Candidatus Kerfeldbacteria bacterium]|nr:hypothetical protein [Candidatus Kerfeldbacteria bacterium]
MTENKLFLTEREVPVGAAVAVYLEGKNEPEELEPGKPMVFRVLFSGVPMRKKFHPVELINLSVLSEDHPDKDFLLGLGFKIGTVLSLKATAMHGFNPNVRFSPLQTFTSRNAPPNTGFAVFVDNKRMEYKNSERFVDLKSDKNGRLISINGYEYDSYLKEFNLAPEAVLVPTSDIGRYEKSVIKEKVPA